MENARLMAQEEKMHETNQRKRTKPVSFRLSEDLIYELKKEASLRQEDLGSFGRGILSRYVDWERHSEKVHLIPVTKEFIKDTMEYLPDEVVKRIASKSGRNMMVDLTLIAQGSLTTEAFVSVFNVWLRACEISFRFERVNGYDYAISHSLGKKWSMYLQCMVEAMCEELPTKTHCTFEPRAESISIHLRPQLHTK